MECKYTTQGELMCRHVQTNKQSIIESFNQLFKACEQDNDCMDRKQSCRAMPISLNATQNVCMPHMEQYRMPYEDKP